MKGRETHEPVEEVSYSGSRVIEMYPKREVLVSWANSRVQEPTLEIIQSEIVLSFGNATVHLSDAGLWVSVESNSAFKFACKDVTPNR